MTSLLGPYEDTKMVDHHHLTGVLAGLLQNERGLVPSKEFILAVDSSFYSKLRDIYDKRLPDYFKRGEVEEKELARKVVNDLLTEAYLEGEEGTKEVLKLGTQFGVPSRTVELGLTSLLIQSWIESKRVNVFRRRGADQLNYSSPTN